MRRKVITLGTTSVLALIAAPALSQTAPAAPASQDAQANVAGSTPAAAQDAANTDVQSTDVDAAASGDVVVTGLRQSLRSAQNIKRNSVQQIDSIVASDIGKLPDVAVSDTAARIPGVQVDRGGGEASRVLIRGLPDFATTYNGREIFTAEARSVALQDFPAGAIAAIEVFKTTTADLVEGGLAGEVNVRSRKPFDFDGLEVAGSYWEQYETRSDHFNPNGNLLVSDRWDTGIGEFGALVNFSYTSLDYLDSSRTNTDFIATPTVQPGNQAIRLPDIQRTDYGEGRRSRPSLNGALQWRPAPGVELYAEALWQGFRNKVSDRELEVPLYGGAAYNNITFAPGTNLVDSVTVVNPNRPDGFQGATYGKTDTYQYAIGGKWDADRFHLSVDGARTTSRFLDSVYSFDTAYASPQTVTVNTGLTDSSAGPSFSFSNANPGSADNYIFRGFFDRQLIAKGKDWQGRADASYDTGLSFLPKIAAGFRYVDRDAHFEDGSRYAYREPDRTPLGQVPVDYGVSHSGFPVNDLVSVYGYYTPTYSGIRKNIDALRTFVGFPQGAPTPDPLATYTSNEKSYAGYGQLNYELGAEGGFHVDGALGVRVVQTKLSLLGTSVSFVNNANVYTPIDTSTKYTDWLPNASARVHFTDQLQLRLSATKTRSRPAFASYDPAVNSGSPPGCEFYPDGPNAGQVIPPAQNTSCRPAANGGNPNLKPLRSTNYDASLEWYFSHTGQLTGAVFRRDLKGFITNFTVEDPTRVDVNGYTLQVNQPFNTGKGRIQGAEGSFTTFLDFGVLPTWAGSFGIDSNVTYLDAKTGVPTSLGGDIQQSRIAGVSKWTYNLAGFYEHNGLSARLSYNYRSSFLSTLQVRNPDIYTETVQGIGRLDFSGSVDLGKNLTLTADWTNILAKPFRSDLTYTYGTGSPFAGTTATYPRVIRYEESVVSAGFRFRF